MGTTITLNASGMDFQGYLATSDDTRAGVIVVHDWFGLLPHVHELCDDLAANGFTTLAPDLYDGRTTIQPDEAERFVEALDFAEARGRIVAAADFLRAGSSERAGTVGLSLGGWLALQSATKGSFDAVVAYYAILEGSMYAPIDCPVLGHLAETDEWESLDVPKRFFAQLVEDGTPASYHVYPGTGHSFANPRAAEYDPSQSATAWERTLAFLREHLSSERN